MVTGAVGARARARPALRVREPFGLNSNRLMSPLAEPDGEPAG